MSRARPVSFSVGFVLAAVVAAGFVSPRCDGSESPAVAAAAAGHASADATPVGPAAGAPRALFAGTIPSAAGWVLILFALPPLFWGWKIIRYTMAVFFGFAAAMVGYELVCPRAGMGWAGAAAGGAMVAGAFVGWHVRKLFAALEGACVIGFVFALPGLLLEHELLTFGLGLVGVALGLALGWKAAFYLDAIDSSLAGGFLAGLGAMIVTQGQGRDLSLLIGIAVLVAAALAGISMQFRSVARAQQRGA